MKEKETPQKYIVLQPIIYVDTKGGSINIADHKSTIIENSTAGIINGGDSCQMNIDSNQTQMQLLQNKLQQLQNQMLQLQNQMQEICNNMYKLIN